MSQSSQVNAYQYPWSGQTLWFHPRIDLAARPASDNWFDPHYWQSQGALTGQAQGRGTTFFFEHESEHFVLRHYRRGGLIGKILNDQYFYTGLTHTRPWRERNLLLQMEALGLPVPQVIAMQVIRRGSFYRADLICRRIPDAMDVNAHLQNQPLNKSVWRDIGYTIKRFHDAHLYHHDLNINNIMLDANNKVWLIDFDKCGFRSGDKWKQQNLARLLRSLNKEKGKHSQYAFTQDNWQMLLDGYRG